MLADDKSPLVRRAAVSGLAMLADMRDSPKLDGRINALGHDADPIVRMETLSYDPCSQVWVDAWATAVMHETDPGIITMLIQRLGQTRWHHENGSEGVLHMHDRCVAALALAPPAAQPAARIELDDWVTQQPCDGQTSAQLTFRLKWALSQCHASSDAALQQVTELLDAMPPTSLVPTTGKAHEF